jgi:7,8-dihydropterin-6-yl-methyl-4-(beta-D-ribofuranosyl)aminobenzene 5'-phosphate synthase
MRLTLIADGSTRQQRIIKRWGVAFVIGDVLFDTFGRQDIFWENISRFKIDMSPIKHVVISHDDWDHIAGLKSFLQGNHNVSVHICSDSGKPIKDMLLDCGVSLLKVDSPLEITKGIFSLGQMRADTSRGVIYEQSLAVQSDKGLSIITGCAHPGITAIVRRAIEYFGCKPNLVCGGFHMKDSTGSDNENIVQELKALGVEKVVPLHCSGSSACKIFCRHYRDNCIKLHEGDVLEL